MAISTYFRYDINPKRFDLFQRSFESLLNTNFNSDIFVIDDGSDTKYHLEYLNLLNDERIVIIEKEKNGGYSKIKNHGIQVILDNGYDFGFLCDDDILYKDNWFQIYLDAFKKTGFPHYCFYDHKYAIHIQDPGTPLLINDCCLRRTPMVQGGVLTFTRQLIEDIGYIKVFPRKLGHEHTHWTYKIINRGKIPGFIDCNNSTDYLSYCDQTATISTRPDDFEEQASENMNYLYKGFEINEPCII